MQQRQQQMVQQRQDRAQRGQQRNWENQQRRGGNDRRQQMIQQRQQMPQVWNDRAERRRQRVQQADQRTIFQPGFERGDRRNRADRGNRGDARFNNDNPRARWNRESNGTPFWANRNYETPRYNRERRESRNWDRDRLNVYSNWDRYSAWDRDDDRRERRRDRRDRWDRDRWDNVSIFPVVNWGDRYRNSYPVVTYSIVEQYYQPYYAPVSYDPYYSSYYPQQNYGWTSPAYVSYDPYYGGYSSPYYGGYSSPTYGGYDPYYASYDPYNSGYYPVNNDYYYEDGYYGDDYYGYNRGGDWKDALLRTVLAVVFGGVNDGYGYDDYDTYASYAPVDPYYTYNGYTPVYAPGGYYTSQPTWIYSPATYDATPYSNTPYRSMIYADPYTRDVTRQALAVGYQQGFEDGRNSALYEMSSYNDPYSYGYGGSSIYSSYSTSLAEREQYLREGYEMGYRDAMEDRDSYGLYEGGGSADLVNVLLGTVLGGIV